MLERDDRRRSLPRTARCFSVALLALGIASISPVAMALPMLVLDSSDRLLGADGVDVDGTLYDVRFLDGTCANVFFGTCAQSNFAFTALGDAVAAANALLAQVFAPNPTYDNSPELTNGCGPNPVPCNMFTPFDILLGSPGPGPDFFVRTVRAANGTTANVVDDTSNLGFDFDTATQPPPPNNTTVWAVWTRVPEPSAFALLWLGFAAMFLHRRRRLA